MGDVSKLKELCEVDGGLETLRDVGNEETFHAFAQIVMPSVTGKMLFRRDAGQILLSAFTTVQDEALGMLCLENNFLKWEYMIKHGTDNEGAKRMKTKYASLANAKDAKQHVRWWTKEAVERYHELVKVVLEKRAVSSIHNLEAEFQLRYNMSFNLRGRSSRKRKFPPVEKVGGEGNALGGEGNESVQISSAQQSYLPAIVVQETAI